MADGDTIPAESRLYDAELIDVDPITRAERRTPVRSDDPRMAPFLAAGRLVPLTPERRAELGLAREAAVRREVAEDAPLEEVAARSLYAAADELTLGLISAAQPGGREAQALFEETHPVVSALSRGAAWVLPALLTGGGSAAAQAGARGGVAGALRGLGGVAAFTPGGLATRAGMAAEGLLGRSLAARGVNPLLARGLGITAGATVDGAVSGAMDAVTRANLTGTPLEAEEIIGGGLFGAGIGLGTGGLFGLPGMLAARQGRRTAQGLGVRSVEQRLADGNLGFSRRVPTADEPGVIGRLGGRVSGVSAEEIGIINHYGPEVFDAQAFRQRGQRAARAATDALNVVEEATTPALNREARVAAAMRDINPQAAHRQALEAQFGELRNSLRAGLESGVAGRGASDLLQRALQDLGERAPATVEEAVRRYDSFLGRLQEDRLLDQAADSSAGPVLQRVYAQIAGDSGTGARGFLSSLGPGGERLAAVHRDILNRQSRFAPVREFGSFEAVNGVGQWRIHADRLMSAYAGGAGEVISRDNTDKLARLIQDTDQRLQNQAALFGTPASDLATQRRKLAEALDAIEEADEWSQVREIALRAQMRESQSAGFYAALGLSGSVVGGMVGASLAGGEGGVAGAGAASAMALLLSAATHPVSATMILQRFGGGVRQAERRIAEGGGRLRRALNSGKNLNVLRHAVPKTVVALRSPERREQEYRSVRDNLRELAGNPQRFEEVLAAGPGAVSQTISQPLGDAMADTYVRGVMYLVQNLPAADQQSLLDAFGADDTPSLVEMDSFLRRYEALEDPFSLLDWAAEGRLDTEHVETVATVYPELLGLIRAEATNVLADVRRLPSYQQRVQVGTLLGVPADQSLSGQMLQRLQQTYAQTTPQDQAQTTRLRSNVSVEMAGHTQTASQSLETNLR